MVLEIISTKEEKEERKKREERKREEGPNEGELLALEVDDADALVLGADRDHRRIVVHRSLENKLIN